jgi:hypothetical protein
MSRYIRSLTLKDQMILSIPQTKNATMRKIFRLKTSTDNFADKKELTLFRTQKCYTSKADKENT